MPATRRQGRRELRGTLIVVILVTTALAIFFLDRLGALFNQTYTVVAVFPSAPGIRSGSPVWVAGIPSGTIRDIALLPPSRSSARVAMDLELSRSVAAEVRRDTRVHFTSARMVGEKVVELIPGSPAAPLLAEGDTLHVEMEPRADQVKASAQAARLALDSLMADVAPLRKRLANRMTEMRAVSRQAALARAELTSLQEGMSEGSLGQLTRITSPGGPLERVQRRADEIQRLLARAQEKVGATRREAAPQQKSLMTHTRQLQSDLGELKRLMNESVGTAGRLQRDSALQKARQGASTQLDSLMTEAKKHPWRFVF